MKDVFGNYVIQKLLENGILYNLKYKGTNE